VPSDGLVEELVDRGLQPIRFDNRDAGHSTRFSGDASYTLSDMADDAVGLLDVLGVDSAHLVGASMGGAVAQMIAIEHADRVRSLTSMMFTEFATHINALVRRAEAQHAEAKHGVKIGYSGS
jgi:pimeloyl-ACP methyl ester carboxylesterase